MTPGIVADFGKGRAPVLLILACLTAFSLPGMTEEANRAVESEDMPREVVLELPPGEENPRNSEGDFITLRKGRLLFIYTRFFGGAGDHAAACLVSRYSDDGGATWSTEDAPVIPNEGIMNVMSVSLLRLQNGSIALFYLRKNGEDDCMPMLRISDDEGATWGPPTVCVMEPVGYYVVNNDRVIQLQNGRLVIPAALHALKGEKFSPRGKIVCFLSDDNGKSWRAAATMLEAPSPIKTGYQEPGIVELSNGALLMLLRNSSGVFYRSLSKDGGDNWLEAEPTDLNTPVSPASFKMLPGCDRILLAWNDHKAVSPGIKGKRTPLTLALSSDNGNTWKHKITLEDNPHGWYCYTAIAFTEHHVLLAYCAGDTRVMKGLSMTRITRIPLSWFLRQLP